MQLRSQTSTMGEEQSGEGRLKRFCVECKATKTPMWRTGPAGKNTLCNACGIRHRKRLNKLNPQGTTKKRMSKKPRSRRTRPSASISTAGSTTNSAAGNSTLTTANDVPPALAAAYGIVGGLRSRCTFKTVRFIVNNTTTVKKRRCFETKRTSLLEEKLAVAALLELAGSALCETL